VSDPRLVIALLAAVAVLTAAARRLRVPAPVTLVCGGAILALVPGFPEVTLAPDVVFYIFLPPLVYSTAILASPTELRADAGTIGQLAVGLVVASMGAVALVAHAALGLAWPVALVLGGVLAPTDPVSATTMLRSSGVPNRLVTILEGESLVNDGTGLVVYGLAVGAATGSRVSPGGAALEFLLVSAGGVATGLLVGGLSVALRRRSEDRELDLSLSLLTPFAAYLGADALGCSGVLAAVTAGVVVGRSTSRMLSPSSRLGYRAFWDAAAFLLSSTLFLLMGLQLPQVVGSLPSGGRWSVVALAGLAGAAIAVVRVGWMVGVAPLLGRRRTPLRAVDGLLLSAAGMRGAVALAAALAIPLTAGDHPFPRRDELICTAFALILASLVLPGLLLRPLARRASLRDPTQVARALDEARRTLWQAALARAAELEAGDLAPAGTIADARQRLERRLRADHGARGLEVGRALMGAQRDALHRLHATGRLDAAQTRTLERELDLEDARLTMELGPDGR
jgi:Na+/H+ antiporter